MHINISLNEIINSIKEVFNLTCEIGEFQNVKHVFKDCYIPNIVKVAMRDIISPIKKKGKNV
jgi:hypothetical protein